MVIMLVDQVVILNDLLKLEIPMAVIATIAIDVQYSMSNNGHRHHYRHPYHHYSLADPH